MAHQLGGTFHIAHGAANALLLPYIIKYNADDAPTKLPVFSQYTHPMAKEKYARAASFLNLKGESLDEKVDSLIDAFKELKKKLDLPTTVIEAGITEKDYREKIDELTYKAFDDQCLLTNPRYPLMSEIKDLYLKLL